MLKAGAELGFSPASRRRVQVANERTSPFAWLDDPRVDPDGLIAKPWDYHGHPEPSSTDKFFDD
jgi:hypothetical protein